MTVEDLQPPTLLTNASEPATDSFPHRTGQADSGRKCYGHRAGWNDSHRI